MTLLEVLENGWTFEIGPKMCRVSGDWEFPFQWQAKRGRVILCSPPGGFKEAMHCAVDLCKEVHAAQEVQKVADARYKVLCEIFYNKHLHKLKVCNRGVCGCTGCVNFLLQANNISVEEFNEWRKRYVKDLQGGL